ncbi:hypothetical protein E2320_020818 [Naja naja]|nr:hypothetical protein E2320_020818 [Naja naja]
MWRRELWPAFEQLHLRHQVIPIQFPVRTEQNWAQPEEGHGPKAHDKYPWKTDKTINSLFGEGEEEEEKNQRRPKKSKKTNEPERRSRSGKLAFQTRKKEKDLPHSEPGEIKDR